jgi:FkbM family methyltransferase
MTATLLDHLRKSAGYEMPRMGPVGFFLYWHLAPKHIDSELVPGIRIDLDMRDNVQKETFWHGGRHEPHLRRALLDLCSSGATAFFDIGANFGFFSYYLLAHVPGLEVHAFEPGERYPAQMLETKRKNGLDRFHIHRMGLGDVQGVLELLVDPVNSGNSSFMAGHPNRLEGVQPVAQKVPVMAFDDWVEQEGPAAPATPSWVAKIDVEGFEMRVLTGMRKSLTRGYFKAVAMEVFGKTLALSGATPANVFDFMQAAGFTGYDEATRKPAQPAQDEQNRNVIFLRDGLTFPGQSPP